MTTEHARLRLKSWICALVVVFSNVSGNFFLKSGVPAQLQGPLAYITVLFRPAVALGVALLILWMASRMALLSWADLSYVLPVTSVGYVLVALAGRLLLHEQITVDRNGVEQRTGFWFDPTHKGFVFAELRRVRIVRAVEARGIVVER